jgi:periplasmic divalent cation tolerance protein
VTDEIIILVTSKPAESDTIASRLVEEQLVACVNILPNITSVYRWDGDICRDTENLLIIKTERGMWPLVEQRIRDLHSYDTPEMLCVPIESGHAPYLDWIRASVQKSAR